MQKVVYYNQKEGKIKNKEETEMMKEYYVTVTGTKGYFAKHFMATTEEEAEQMIIDKYKDILGKVKKVNAREV